MFTKGEIQSVDYNSNTCMVRIPLYENPGMDMPVIGTATMMIPPGIYNGYKAGDVVWVSFENDEIQDPVVVGKLYLGAKNEHDSQIGTLSCEDLYVNSNASIPLGTTIITDPTDVSETTTYGNIKTIKVLIDVVKALQETVSTQDTEIKALEARVTKLEEETATNNE